MWETWIQAKTYHLLPHEVFEPDKSEWQWGGTYGPMLRWMFDAAVTWFGITIENALHERVEIKVGNVTKSNPKYPLARLLHPSFRLPRPVVQPENDPNPWAVFFGWAGKKNSMMKRYAYVKPAEEKVM